MKQLIVYFSRAGENYVGGKIERLEVGNTEVAAGMIQNLTNADMFKLEMAQPYSPGHSECIKEARRDLEGDARPELKALPGSMDGYDVIYLGYPNYWNTMPMAVATFLESADFAGKTILPFCTHEGSGLGVSEQDIRRICPAAAVGKGIAIRGGSVRGAEQQIREWIG